MASRSWQARSYSFFYKEETGAEVLVYRFPNLFGKWCRPDYNSAVTVMWANEAFDPNRPDTFFEKVKLNDES